MYINVLELLENSAAKYPARMALRDEKHQITYEELERQAKAVGCYIHKNLGRTGSPIAVCIDRNIESIILFLGIVYSGNFYVPLDINLPSERIALILEDLKPAMILASANQTIEGKDILPYDELMRSAKNFVESDAAILQQIRDNMIDTDPLYAIFTSGSTGRPKGVLISHRGVIDLVEQFAITFPFEKEPVFGNQAPFDFDVSVKDIYNSLFLGGTVVVIPKQCFSMPLKLIEFINTFEINTAIWAVSAMRIVENFKTFSKLVPTSLKLIMFSGEIMPVRVLNYWKEYVDATYVNLYGPTEITCNCSYFIINRDFAKEESLPIGKAFRNTQILLVDSESHRVITEPNQQGEICVRGTCLAHGYYNDPEKTGKAFAQNVTQYFYPERIYHTGDMGYYNEKGELMFASRMDYQIKHMGHRIELGEIEVVINAIAGIDAGVCIFDTKHEKIVLCYQCGADAPDEAAMKAEIVTHLKEKLPKYMWPNRYVRYDTLPLNKNGKIDRVALKNQHEGA